MQERARFIKNTGKIVFSKFILVILKAGLGIVTARAFGPLGKGLFVLSNQIPGFFTMFSNLSLGEALTVLISQDKIRKREMFGTFGVLFLLITSITTLAYYLTLPLTRDLLWKIDDPTLPYWSGLIIPVVVGEYFCTFAIRGARRYTLYTIMSLTSKAAALVALFFACWVYHITVVQGVVLFIAVNFLFVLGYAFSLWILSERCIQTTKKNITSALRYGITIHPSVLLSDLEYRSDVYLLAFFMNPAAIGIYSVAVTLAQLSWYFTNSVNTVFLPELGATTEEKQSQRTAKVCRTTFLVTAMANLGLLILGYPLVSLLYGSAFSESYLVMCWLVPGILFDSCFRILSSYYKNRFRNGLLNTLSIASLAANIILNCALIPRFGIYGAAASSAVSYSLKGLLISRAFVREHHLSLRTLLIPTAEEFAGFRNVIQRKLLRRTSS